MNDAQAWALIQSAIAMGLRMSLPFLLGATMLGLIVSVGKALTQLQEQTLGLTAKVAFTLATLWALGPWMIHCWVAHLRIVLEGLGAH